jgi:hypothetical protein
MKLYIPEIGDKIQLKKTWTFDLYLESRNKSLTKHFFDFEYNYRTMDDKKYEYGCSMGKVSLPENTTLKVDRIYIRKGAEEFSSLSFIIDSTLEKGLKGSRFWAKLSDCNSIEFDFISPQKKEKKIGFTYGIWKIKSGDFYRTFDIKPTQTSYKTEGFVITPSEGRKYENVLKVVMEYEMDIVKNDKKLFFYKTSESCTSYYKNVKYTLYDLNGKELGSWVSFDAMKKNAKIIVNQ